LNYLSATGFQLGLLVNFGHCPKLEFERFANTKKAIARERRETTLKENGDIE